MAVSILVPWSGNNTGDGNGGDTILYGEGAPSSLVGTDGATYIDRQGSTLYGPKTNGAWPPALIFGNRSFTKMESTGQIEVEIPGSKTVELLISNPLYIELYINGQLQSETAFSVDGKNATIHEEMGLLPGDTVEFTYEITSINTSGGGTIGGGGGSEGVSVDEVPAGDRNSTNVMFLLSYTPLPNSLALYINGLLADSSDFSITGAAIRFNFPPTGKIRARYSRQSGG